MKKSSIGVASHIVTASALLLIPGCLQQTDDTGAEEPVYEGEAAQRTFQLRNEGTGKCVRRSTSLVTGNGYEVYQASCSSAPSAELLWRQECGSNGCRYMSGAYCLKASSTVKASGGSYDVYVAPCSDDRDQRWDGFRSRETGRCMYASESEHTSDGSAQSMLQILTDVTDGPQITAVFRMVAHHPAIRNRVHHLRQHVFSSAAGLAKVLERHTQNVDWQLRRIYRARNHVAHRGGTPVGARHLIQHLHTYFAVACKLLIRTLAAHKQWSIGDAFEHHRMLHTHYLRMLKDSSRAAAITIPQVVFPEAVLSPTLASLVWNRAASTVPGPPAAVDT